MGEAITTKDNDAIDVVTPTGGYTAGQIVQAPDGRAAYVEGLKNPDAGDAASLKTSGQVTAPKTAGVKFLDGQRLYWDASVNALTFRRNNHADFYAGTAVGDATSAATEAVVNLNVRPVYVIELASGETTWTAEATLGLGATLLPGGGAMLAFDAVAEVAQAALFSNETFLHTAKPIFEGWFAIFDVGNNSALDITIGIASSSHASDFQTVANFVAIHLDGNDLSILVESDDGTTDVAPVDSTIDAVDDVKFFLQIDARDPDDVRVLVNGVDVVPDGTTLVLTAATNELRPIVHLEKTSDDTTADVRVYEMGVRTSGNV